MLLLFVICFLGHLDVCKGDFALNFVIEAFQTINPEAYMAVNNTIIAQWNLEFPGFTVAPDSYIWNSTVYRLSQGLRPARPVPIGKEVVFFQPNGTIVFYLNIFSGTIRDPGGEIIHFAESDADQGWQAQPYVMGDGNLQSLEGITGIQGFTAITQVIYATGAYEKFTNGYGRIHCIEGWTLDNSQDGLTFETDCVETFKWDSNLNPYAWSSHSSRKGF